MDTNRIIEFDVMKLYPNDGEKFVLTEGQDPEKSKALFIKIMKSLYEKRLEYKKQQNKPKQ